MLTQNFLRECFDYDPETGVLTWKTRPRTHFPSLNAHATWNARYSGKEAGNIQKGYRRVSIGHRYYKVHRVIWTWETGLVPTEIDHRKGNPLDNRLVNLRDTDRLGNQRNRKLNINNKTGVAGVYIDKRTGRFQAMISVQSRRQRLGSFLTLEEAMAARSAAERKFGFYERTQESHQTMVRPIAAALTA